EGRAGEFRPEDERLQARDDRVAAEDGHEPRHACSRELADPGAGGLHPQRGEIGDRLSERVAERIPGGPQLRHAELPRSQRIADPSDLLAEPALREPWGHELTVRKWKHLDVECPALARLELEMEGDRRSVHLAALREDDLRLQRQVAGVPDQETV